jgi:hypothetical protein
MMVGRMMDRIILPCIIFTVSGNSEASELGACLGQTHSLASIRLPEAAIGKRMEAGESEESVLLTDGLHLVPLS